MSLNAFTVLRDLLAPPAPLMAGEVTSISDGVATVALAGGGITTARGNVPVGAYVMVRDGVIEATRDPLPVYFLEV